MSPSSTDNIINADKEDFTESQKTQIEETLIQLDHIFDNSFDWWAKVYDSKSGGCFYSLSAKESAPTDKRFAPDIEATSKLVNVLEWTGLLEDCPKSFRQGVIRFMQQRQDPESGFFRNPQHKGQYDTNRLERATGMAAGSLIKCGGKALYPLPIDRTEKNIEAALHYKKLESVENLRNWLDQLPWDSFAWRAGASIRTLSEIFQNLPEPKRTKLLDAVEKYIHEKQQESGLFGTEKDSWQSRLSGTYKIAAFLVQNGRPIPRAKEMTERVLYHLKNSNYTNSIVLYNTVNILNVLHKSRMNFNINKRIEIVNCCIKLLEKMKGPDGAFLTLTDKPAPRQTIFLMGREVLESNTNASGLMHKTRKLLIELLTGNSGPHPHPKGIDLVKSFINES